MGKRILLLALSLLMLLSACGKTPETPPTTETTAPAQPTQTEPADVPSEPQPSYVLSPPETLSPVALEADTQASVTWSSGNRVLLLETAEMSLYLCKISQNSCIVYDIQMENKSSTRLKLEIPEFYYNGNIRQKSSLLIYADPGQWGYVTGRIPFPIASALGEMDPITGLDLLLVLSNGSTLQPILRQAVHVDITGNAVLQPFYHQPAADVVSAPVLEYFFSGQQLLAEQDGVRVTVLQVGRSQKNNELYCHLRIANTADDWRYYQYSDIAINGLQCTANSGRTDLRPGAVFYDTIHLDDFHGMEAIGSVDLRIATGTGRYEDGNPATAGWYTVCPDAASENPSVISQDQLLLQEKDLEVYLCSGTYSYFGDPIWQIAIVNKSQKDLSLALWDTAVGDDQGTGSEYMGVVTDNNAVYAGKTVIMEIQPYNTVAPVSFRLRVKEQQTGTELYITENRVSLELPETTQ